MGCFIAIESQILGVENALKVVIFEFLNRICHSKTYFSIFGWVSKRFILEKLKIHHGNQWNWRQNFNNKKIKMIRMNFIQILVIWESRNEKIHKIFQESRVKWTFKCICEENQFSWKIYFYFSQWRHSGIWKCMGALHNTSTEFIQKIKIIWVAFAKGFLCTGCIIFKPAFSEKFNYG